MSASTDLRPGINSQVCSCILIQSLFPPKIQGNRSDIISNISPELIMFHRLRLLQQKTLEQMCFKNATQSELWITWIIASLSFEIAAAL